MVPNLDEKFRFHQKTPFLNPEMLFVAERRYIGQYSSFFLQEPETR